MSAPLDYDLSPEAVALLRAGADDVLGYCCSPGRVVANWAAIREAEKRDYIRFLGEHPWITSKGRDAIGAPSETEAGRLRAIAAFGQRKPRLVPEKRNDPRTDFDYRSYKSCGYYCTLLIKQPDDRENASTTRVGKTLTSEKQFLGPRNSIILPESEGRFVLALMPSWLIKRCGFSMHPWPLDETDPNFTDDERALWDRLRLVCQSVNSRIRSAGRRQQEVYRFGESA